MLFGVHVNVLGVSLGVHLNVLGVSLDYHYDQNRILIAGFRIN